MRVRLLAYDIPETSDLPNPSAELHRRGVRVNLSCWAIPDTRIPWELLESLSQGGATWHLIRFDQQEERAICDLVVSSLRRELDIATRAAEHAEQRARELTDGGRNADERLKYARRARAGVALALRRLKAAAECAAGFREDRITSEIEQAQRTMSYLRARVENQAQAYTRMIHRLGVIPGEHAAGMTLSAREGDLPPEIGADYLSENGTGQADEEASDAVRAAFGQ